GIGKARLDDGIGGVENPDNRVNPLFFAWADDYEDYQRSDGDTGFGDPGFALGPVTGNNFDVVSLGDMTAAQIVAGDPSGRVTLVFPHPIRNRTGADFVVFENGFTATFDTGGDGIGGVFAELAHIEVSADGETFHRFPSDSLTPGTVGGFGTIDPSNVFNLAGKHVNAGGESWGTPFDIGELGLEVVTHLRVVDIPGDGSFSVASSQPIYDAWHTFGSGGFDLEAVGAISVDMSYDAWPALQQLPSGERGRDDDPDGDGISNLLEYALSLVPWQADPPSSGWGFSVVSDAGSDFFELTTRRDERLVDLTREIQVSGGASSWTTMAISHGGAPFQQANGFSLSITEERAGEIASIAVIRRDRVRDLTPIGTESRRIYRLKVTEITP
ncbi:MAG: hypothetical protein AAGB14_11135, partial [Verrucomicrobiota bacterium]